LGGPLRGGGSRQKNRRRDRLILIAVMILVGLFLIRRSVRLAHLGGHSDETAAGVAPPNENISPENISPDERQRLDQLIHDKSRR
jgi:hypothetical protein